MELTEKLERQIEQAAELLTKAKYVVGLTGAGISVESGIRPFRGPDGLWTEHGEPPLDEYQRTFADPKVGWEKMMKGEVFAAAATSDLAKTFLTAKPNPGHYALAELEELGILKYLITQNVDNLHRAAGSKKLAEIHGNLFLLRCMRCNSRYNFGEISFQELPPSCPKCKGPIKPDGVMFGEPIPSDVLHICQEETSKCDCMLLSGTSAFVYPTAGFPQLVKRRGGTLIEVNPYETELTRICDISLRGKGGEILPQLVNQVKSRMKQ